MILMLMALTVTLALLAHAFWQSRLRILRLPPSDLVIFAAHSDDCVIMGSELASVTIKAGHRVRIIFLTCSAASPDEEMARIRADEARAAWSKLGVSAECLTFLDLPQSPVAGPASYTPAHLSDATERIGGILGGLDRPTCVLVPAWGESHIDHRSLRDVVLAAVDTMTRRDDLIVLETPEYNHLVSLTQDPLKALATVLRALPGGARLLGPMSRPAHFAGGPAGRVVDPSSGALTAKLEMLQAFVSQDPRLLRAYFRSRSLYRLVDPSRRAAVPRLYRFADHQADATFLALVACLFVLAFSLGAVCSEYVPPLGWLVGGVTIAALAYAVLRRRRFFAALAVSLLFGTLMGAV